MKNYVQSGDVVTFIAAALTPSGTGVLVNALFGVAAAHYEAGEQGEMKTIGVFDLAADPALTAAAGALAYWSEEQRAVVAAGAADALIGVFVQPKVADVNQARVRLGAPASASPLSADELGQLRELLALPDDHFLSFYRTGNPES